ncbi:uncharacterized protein EI90DRAFT_2892443, partial [Cantharellus anzutake]|uniref:uncharacterized protein n=1 Tax=Cantharellus anzutake TaxID=1750568 RepID=UPI0019047BED
GGIINVKWAADAAVYPGSLCNWQGILKNVGDVGVAMFILAITIHTAAVLLWRWKVPRRSTVPLVVMLAIWLFIALENGISWALYHRREYITDTGMWCWIGPKYTRQRILFEYAWMWITTFFTLLVYVPLYFSLRGNLYVSGLRVIWTNCRSSADPWQTNGRRAGPMLWYPLAYTITVLPIAICRWRAFNGHDVPWAATVVSDVLFCSSGLVNSLLYPLTRPSLL